MKGPIHVEENLCHDLLRQPQETAHPSGAATLVQPSGTTQLLDEGEGVAVAAGADVAAGGEDGHPQSAPVPDGV